MPEITINPDFIRGELKRLPLLILGTLISAFGFAIFLAPHNLSAGLRHHQHRPARLRPGLRTFGEKGQGQQK